jgi:hypothetical protein
MIVPPTLTSICAVWWGGRKVIGAAATPSKPPPPPLDLAEATARDDLDLSHCHRRMGEEGRPSSPNGRGRRPAVVEWGREEARRYAVEGRREPARTAARGRPRSVTPSSKGGGQPPSLGPRATLDRGPTRRCGFAYWRSPPCPQPLNHNHA